MAEEVSAKEIYRLFDDFRKEMAGSRQEITNMIQRLEDKVANVLDTRVTVIEKDFANLQGKITVIAAVTSIVISFLFLLINLFLKR